MMLPHLTQSIVDSIGNASREMRAWMERIATSVNPVYVTISGSYTTSGNMFLRVTVACTITLNPSPEDGETVQIQPNGNFTVTISGSINGASSLIMNHAYDLADLRYVSNLGEWVIQ